MAMASAIRGEQRSSKLISQDLGRNLDNPLNLIGSKSSKALQTDLDGLLRDSQGEILYVGSKLLDAKSIPGPGMRKNMGRVQLIKTDCRSKGKCEDPDVKLSEKEGKKFYVTKKIVRGEDTEMTQISIGPLLRTSKTSRKRKSDGFKNASE
ncbi:hypothetical protein Bca101_055644 [Brassica carinata]